MPRTEFDREIALANKIGESGFWTREDYNSSEGAMRLSCAVKQDGKAATTVGGLILEGVKYLRMPAFLGKAVFSIEGQAHHPLSSSPGSMPSDVLISISASGNAIRPSSEANFVAIASAVRFDPEVVPYKGAAAGDPTLFTSATRGRFGDLEGTWGRLKNLDAVLATIQAAHSYIRLDFTAEDGYQFHMGFANPVFIDLPTKFKFLELQRCNSDSVDIITKRLGDYLPSIEHYFSSALEECADMITVFATDQGPYFVWSRDVRF